MTREEMERRTKEFALRVLKLVHALPKDVAARAVAGQLARSGTSIGANYRAAGRGRSRAEFAAKLGIAEEEADETCYWLEIIIEGQMLTPSRVEDLLDEANQLRAMIATARKSAKKPATQ